MRPLRVRSRCDGGWECVRQTWCAREDSWGRGLDAGRVLGPVDEGRFSPLSCEVATTDVEVDEMGRLQTSQT